MTKPAITLRSTKGAALTYEELDANFSNIKDATISITAGSGGTQVSADLNGNITLVAGSNITLTGNNSAKTITITASGGGSGSGTVMAGDQYDFAYYDAAGSQTQVNNTHSMYLDSSGNVHLNADLYLPAAMTVRSDGGNINFNDDINFPSDTGLLVSGSGTLLLRGGGVKIETANDPGLTLSGITTGTPSNTSTPTGYIKVVINTVTRYIPYYS